MLPLFSFPAFIRSKKWLAVGVLLLCASASQHAVSDTTTTTSTASTSSASTVTLSLNKGWNLIGTGGVQAFAVGNYFSDSSKVVSVWKWISNQSQWAFYAPSMSLSALVTYADSKGYAALDGVNGSDGFWVNAAQAHNVTLPFNGAYKAINHRGSLVSGWNLVADGETDLLPVQFNNRLTQYSGSTPPTVGLDTTTSVYQPNLTSLWAWDATHSNWFFYAPTLDRDQTLTAYTQSKGYADFASNNKTLGPGVGFWVNVPSSSTTGTTSISTSSTSSSSSTTVASTTTTTVKSGTCTQLLGTAGDDTFNPIGFCHQELTLSPGNNTFNLGLARNFQFNLSPVNFTPTTGASVNLTSNTVTANGLQLKPRSINNGYGGTDTINFADAVSNYMMYFWSSPKDDYFIKDSGSVYWDVAPNSGTDTVISNGGFLGIDLFNFSNANITITGSSGTIKPDDNTTVNYQGVNGWDFWNGSYNITAAASNLSFTFWNGTNNSNFVHQYVRGGGSYQNFYLQTSNLVLHILDFNSTDKLGPNFLSNWAGNNAITPDLIEQSISLTNDTSANTTTVSFTNSNSSNSGTYGVSSFVVNGIYTSYTINVDNTVSLNLTPQTITFSQPSAQTVGSTISLSATASSGLAVSYSTSTPSVCTLSGNTLSLVAAGTCSVKASQSGNSTYAAATNVTRTIAVSLPTQTITFNSIDAQTVGSSVNLSATASSGLPVSYSISTASVCYLSGTTLNFVQAGTCTVKASQSGDGAYAAAANVTQSITVSPVTESLMVSTLAGTGQSGYQNGAATSSNFYSPFGVVSDASGNVYVADTNNLVIRKISADGVVSTVAGSGQSGYLDGAGTAATFVYPISIAIDSLGNLYVGDRGNESGKIRKISPTGVVTTLAGTGAQGHQDGAGNQASFFSVEGVSVDAAGNVYVADRSNNKIRKVTPQGVVSTYAGTGGAGSTDGAAAVASFNMPRGLALDASGNLYVSDYGSGTVRKISVSGNVSTVASGFSSPMGIAIDALGKLYVLDNSNKVYVINTSGQVSTFAGTGRTGAVNGQLLTSTFSGPVGLHISSSGDFYIAETGNNDIRKISRTAATAP